MSIFIKNYRKYLSENDIKQSYICLVTDIEKNKLSRILNGSQNITEEDMNKMSKAVGKSISYFLREEQSRSALCKANIFIVLHL